jgi:hypothetical protein
LCWRQSDAKTAAFIGGGYVAQRSHSHSGAFSHVVAESTNTPHGTFTGQSPTEINGATYEALTQMQQIRQGTTERAGLVLDLGTELIVSPRNRGGALIPLKLEFAPEEGVMLSDFQFPADDRNPHSFQSDPLRLIHPKMAIQFKVKASRKAALGNRTLQGKLTYQIVRDQQALPPQVLDLELPLSVIEHDSVTTKSTAYTERFGDTRADHHVLMWVLSPILIPAIAAVVLVCLAAHIDCFD